MAPSRLKGRLVLCPSDRITSPTTDLYGTGKGEGIVSHDRPLSEQACHNVTWVLYEPDLTGFNHLVNNVWTRVLHVVEHDDIIVDRHSFNSFCRRFLVMSFHMMLNREYQRIGVPTESFGKLMASVNPTRGVEVPRILLDICREIARPMEFNGTIFVPWLNADFTDGQAPCAGIGIPAPAFERFGAYFAKSKLETRNLIEEHILPSPLGVFDGAYGALSDDLAIWRREALDILRPLHNGCKVYGQNGARTIFNRASVPDENDQINVWNPRLVTRNLLIERNIDEVEQLTVDTWATPEPIEINAFFNDLGIMDDAAVLRYSMLFTRGERIIDGRFWFFIAPTVAERMDVLNDWFSYLRGGLPSLPPIRRYRKIVLNGLLMSHRFPTDVRHSTTPPTGRAGQQTVKRPRKKKVQSSAPGPPDEVRDSRA